MWFIDVGTSLASACHQGGVPVDPTLGLLLSDRWSYLTYNSSLPTFLFRQNNDVIRIRSRDKIPLIIHKYTVQLCNVLYIFFKMHTWQAYQINWLIEFKSFKRIEYFDIFPSIKDNQNHPTIHNLLICNLYMNST